MLSRVVEESGVEITPMIWCSASPRTVSAIQPAPEPFPGGISEEDSKALEQKLRQAHDSGWRSGEAAALQKAQQQIKEMARRLSVTIAEIASTRSDVIRRAEADVVRLSIEIARRILHRELSVDTSALEGLIRAALEKLTAQEIYRVRVHPDQEQLVRECLRQIGRDAEIEVISDVSQPRGGAIFEINRGSLDASVDTQLREIERGLTDQLGDR